jgi:hypothetical protein
MKDKTYTNRETAVAPGAMAKIIVLRTDNRIEIPSISHTHQGTVSAYMILKAKPTTMRIKATIWAI